MDLTSNKLMVVSCGVGGWYPQGIKRLTDSLVYHGFPGDLLCYRGEYPPNSPTHQDNPYAFKIFAIGEALLRGATHILWLDSSIWAIKDVMPIFDHIEDHGYYFFKTGYNCAQSCNDNILNFAGITRDEAEGITECASGMVGLKLKGGAIGLDIFNEWKRYMEAGMFKGSRLHDHQSSDPRFLFHRQDQSALALIAHKMGLKAHEQNEFIAYYGDSYGTINESVKLLIRGM